MTPTAQATGERQVLPMRAAGSISGSLPRAAAALARRSRSHRASHGAIVTAAVRPHTARSTRHPAEAASGAETSADTPVLIDMSAVVIAVRVPSLSGKYRFTAGGRSTLPTPTPASVSALASSSDT